MPKTTPETNPAAAEKIVLEYMRTQNRPYAATDVFLNLHGAVGKAAVVRALASLASADQLTKKEYGKSTLYVIRQRELPVLDEAQMEELKQATKDNRERVLHLQIQIKKVQAELSALLATPTNEEIPQRLASAANKRDALRAQLADQGQGQDLPAITPEQAQNLGPSIQFWRDMWVSRRRAERELTALIRDAARESGGELLSRADELDEDLCLPPHEAMERERTFLAM